MQLFYNSEISLETKQITFDKIESKHIVRVLRKTEGDILKITNGKGFLFDVEINFANDKRCSATIINAEEKIKPWHYYLHIAIAPTKNNDRIEWFLEKATEIGIDEITPIICSNSERRIVKLERFEKIIQSAMKQSLKFTLPKLNAPIKFNDFIQQGFDGKVCIAHCEEQNKTTLKSTIQDEDFKKTKDKSEFIHTENFVLVDKKARIRGVYNGTLALDIQRLKRHIEILKKEKN